MLTAPDSPGTPPPRAAGETARETASGTTAGTTGDVGSGRDRFAALRRELTLVCDAAGCVRWADPLARRGLGAEPGVMLTALAAPGTEDKVAALLDEARSRHVDRCEAVLLVDGRPATLAFSGAPDGDEVLLAGSLVPEEYSALVDEVSSTMHELSTLHRASARQQQELERRQEELLKVNRELDDSYRGITALYGELDEQATALKHTAEVKSRFVANVSHEFKTPINSILGLTRLLVAEHDGPLTSEQAKQLGFVRQSADALSVLVHDLLDLSKAEFGKLALRPAPFAAADLVGSLRGMLRPLAVRDGVALVIEDPPGDLPALETDEGKVAQVLRNLVSNALKFTERGEVRVSARGNPDGTVTFAVVDTGIGIAPADQARVFEEFTQVEGPLQRQARGTGLGLTLSRSLASLLGGTLTLESAVGRGSTFELTIPARHPEAAELAGLVERSQHLDPVRRPILVVEDDSQTLFLYEKYLEGSGFQVLPARSIGEARAALRRVRPAAIVLDVMLDGETSWGFLTELKADPATRDIPALVVTITNREQRARALGADEFSVKPLDREWFFTRLAALATKGPVEKVLVVDDDPTARYLVRKMLEGTPYTVLEAADGPEGVELARRERPDVIVLDFVMPQMTAFEVLDELKCDPRTRSIPVIVNTSKDLSDDERGRLAADTQAVLSKQSLSREIAISRIREALEKAAPTPAAAR